jgi:hypothetical protein
MKNKPDYKGYVLYQQEINKLGIPQSCNDLLELYIKFHIPFPKDAIQDGRVRRDDLINRLAFKWREAENHYLETEGNDSLKLKLINTKKIVETCI